jgi:hypothetical protein
MNVHIHGPDHSTGTHFDDATHATDGRGGDMASPARNYLIDRGTIVDLSHQVTD